MGSGAPPGRPRRAGTRAAAALLALAALALAWPASAAAAFADEQALGDRFAPVVRIVEQPEECSPGEPFQPTDVNVLLGDPTVALRGPWSGSNLVKIGPAAADLVNRYEYHLDFPGDALNPGCSYELWARRLTEGSPPTVYSHVATDPEHPGLLALQYWFFWPFNEFNNLHEGDWEMIQLVFDAGDAREALGKVPVAVGFSSHEGAERADWGDDKLEVVDGTHVVLYPAAGSHANKFTSALYIGSSAEAGVGCDDTLGPHTGLRPVVEAIPSDRAAAEAAYPWIAFEGRWGELQKAFFNGPTGPNLKTQWTQPIEWSQGWRERSYAVPAGGVFGTRATDFFCAAVAAGSRGLIGFLRNPGLALLVSLALLGLLAWGISRTTWRPSEPLRVMRRRSWGQTLATAARMYVRRPTLFLGIGVLFVPLALVISFLQALLLGGFGLLGVDTTGDSAGGLAGLIVGLGTILTLLALALVQAATARALVEVDAGRPIGPLAAYRSALRKIGPLLGGLVVIVAVSIVLNATLILIPLAIWLAVRWMLLAQVVELEGRSAFAALRRSSALVRGRWFRVWSLVGLGAVLALSVGPLLGALLILGTDASLTLLNLVAGVVYALTMPLVALATSYVYFDARVRESLEPDVAPGPLPAEAELPA